MVTTTPPPHWTRPLEHLGAPAEVRRSSISTLSVSMPVALTPGALLVDAMVEAVESLGVTCGQIELLDGFLSSLEFCHPTVGEPGRRRVAYSEALTARVPARLIAGSATVGFRDGERFAHCHAAWFDANGEVRGGHIWPSTWIGAEPVHAVVHALDEVDLISTVDPECDLPTFTPHRRSGPMLADAGEHRAVISRLAPGIVVDAAIREIMAEEGFTRASIAGSLGSLVGTVLRRDGNFLIVDGPATEITLTGEYDLGAPSGSQAMLSGFAVDCQGRVYAGEFVAEESIVACTMELLVRELR